jgi:hypothetical protein
MAVGFSLWSFGIFFQFWYFWTKKNLATLVKALTFGSVESCVFVQQSSTIECSHQNTAPPPTVVNKIGLGETIK